MERLARRYADRPVQFVLVYTREPHAKEGIFRDIDQPADFRQRRDYAERTCAEMNIRREILVDDMEGTVQRLYGGLPNMVYVIDPHGKVVFHDRWADAEAVGKFLESTLPVH